MIEYFITIIILIIANIIYLKWYFKNKCIPISQIAKKLSSENNSGYNEGVAEWKIKLEREKKHNNNQNMIRQYEHETEIKNLENKITRLENEIKTFYDDMLKVKNDKSILKISNEKFQNFIREATTSFASILGKSEKLTLAINKIDIDKPVIVYKDETENERN